MNLIRTLSPLLAFATAACIADFAPVEELPSDRARDAGVRADGGTGTSPRGGTSGGNGGGGPSGDDEDVAPIATPERDPSRAPCDLSGGWVVTERMMLNALGARQVINTVSYLELTQEGDDLTVSRSLLCGDYVKGLPPILITMDSSKLWDVLRTRTDSVGRRGTSRAAAGGCSIALEKQVHVRGATAEAYADLDVPLPKPEEKASGGAPGWEDWDEDGNPGVSVRVSGSLSGTLYVTSRAWTEVAGLADPARGTFALPLKWNQERVPLGVSGSPLLAAPGGAPDADSSQHLIEFAAASASALGGSDGEICARVRELAPTLTPRAMK